MKKIIYLANIRLPTEKAHGLQIMKTCEALAKEGVAVELVVPRRLNAWKEDPFVFYGIAPNFKITRLWCLDFISLKFLGRVGYWLTIVTFYWSAKRYIQARNEANDGSVVYYTRDLLIAYSLTKKYSPLFYEVHALPNQASAMHRDAWSRSSGLLVISDGLKKELIAQGVPERKILVARDAVDVQTFTRSDSAEFARHFLNLDVAASHKMVVYTGHLYDWKGAATLAEAAQFLPKDIAVYLVGGTADDAKKFSQKYHFPNLRIVGWQTHAMIPYWLQAADVLVLPTSGKDKIGSHYTSPLKLFEYMASGRPIVVADLPSIREIINESMAEFFTPDDPGALAGAIQLVLAHEIEAKEKAGRARQLAAERYGWRERARAMTQFIFSS